MLLGIDTSQSRPAMALMRGDRVLAAVPSETWPTPLVALFHEVCRRARITADRVLDGLDAVAVAVGPGRYTSLRSGVSFAKGLAAARELRIVGVPTEAAIAAAARIGRGSVLIPAGRDRLYLTRVGEDAPEFSTVSARALGGWSDSAPVAGEMTDEVRAALARQGATAIPVTSDETAVAVARLARRLLTVGQGPATYRVTPRYLASPGGADAVPTSATARE